MTSLASQIDELLAAARPARYQAKDPWLTAISTAVAKLIPDEDLASVKAAYARTLVLGRERSATGRANSLLRWIKRTGTIPMFWASTGADPIIVNGERIRLDAATPVDMHLFEDTRRGPTKDRYETAMETLDGAVFLADLAIEHDDELVWTALSRLPVTEAPAEDDDDGDQDDDE